MNFFKQKQTIILHLTCEGGLENMTDFFVFKFYQKPFTSVIWKKKINFRKAKEPKCLLGGHS